MDANASTMVTDSTEVADEKIITIETLESQHPRVGSGYEENLRGALKERHVNMIAFSGTIGIGILVTSGTVLHHAGPGGATLAYALTGTVAWSVIASLGEMTALMPVKAPIVEFASRYVDSAVGFATGWMYWFSYVTAYAALIVASSSLIQFNYDDKIKWTAGISYSPIIWIFLFMLYMLLVNLLPIKLYGEYEYFCGCVKITTIVGLILLMTIITDGVGNSAHIGNRYWRGDWGFFSRNFTTSVHGETMVFTGDKGRLLAMWTAMTLTIWSYLGMDIVAATAAETRGYGDSESIKIATRKISLRIILLYFFCIVTVSFAVPYDDPHLTKTNHGNKSGASSPFMVAIVNAGIPVLPHILNAFFIFSASSAGINSLYVASRTLHAMAVEGRVLDGFITRRLKRTNHGVPMYAVFASATFGLLTFMSVKTAPAQVLSGLTGNSSVSLMVVYWVISLTYICFYSGLVEKCGSEEGVREYRGSPKYPYRSHFQWLRAVYGLTGCSLFILFSGWQAFLGRPPVAANDFIPLYISPLVFILLVVAYKLNDYFRYNGTLGRHATNLFDNRQLVNEDERRGSLNQAKLKTPREAAKEVLRFLAVWTI